MKANKKTNQRNYLKFILIAIGVFFITLLLLAMFTTKSVATVNNPLANILKDFENQSTIESSNLLSYVRQNTITEPTINSHSPVLGNTDAPVTIFEFSCYGCPASRDIQPVLKNILNKYSDQVKIVWKDLPIPDLYPQAELAHLASRCAGDQGKFWEYHNLLWQNQDNFSIDNLKSIGKSLKLDTNKLSNCINAKQFQNLIDQDVSEAADLAISGTPHFYVNNQEIFGVATLEDFEIVINAELNR